MRRTATFRDSAGRDVECVEVRDDVREVWSRNAGRMRELWKQAKTAGDDHTLGLVEAVAALKPDNEVYRDGQ